MGVPLPTSQHLFPPRAWSCAHLSLDFKTGKAHPGRGRADSSGYISAVTGQTGQRVAGAGPNHGPTVWASTKFLKNQAKLIYPQRTMVGQARGKTGARGAPPIPPA